jgi:hypothetical protein
MRRSMALVLMAMMAVATASTVRAQTGTSVVPANLKAPAGNVLLFKTFATGTQIYVCAARADSREMFGWTFKAPEAELWNDLGEKVGRHYAGPSWEGNDGSKVIGEVVARADAADPDAIPWLLLRAASHAGTGVFSTISYIQRLETVGGVAPAQGCDRSTAGTERAVPYTAVYAFFYSAAQ